SMRSRLYLDKLPEQAKLLNPDVAVVDFGTNDILYYNTVEANLPPTISQIIKTLRDVNPEMLIILTSTQDLFRHGRYITAGPKFRDLVASVARAEHAMFWNWYDLSGGLHSIRDWYNAGYAQPDCIHLTAKGYDAKGSFLYSSIKNTIELVKQNPTIQQHTVPMKDYADILKKHADDFRPSTTYKVKPGDSLFAIALRYHTTVKAIMQANKLNSDFLRIGQILEIPKSK
ncbi:LysM peptidoglycan-binding domain-containing protein, partial [Candidatus Symbiothrix dinenymphae]|uniref:LysM peptidoglycan-binding domain-containing protein n=1 Tax=Candidatus Symbiothrix dinenymphae TaxID=467085 RepID=UPI000A74515A